MADYPLILDDKEDDSGEGVGTLNPFDQNSTISG